MTHAGLRGRLWRCGVTGVTDRVVPVDADEVRVSEWRAHLRVTRATHPEPDAVEGAVISRLATPARNQTHDKPHPS